jgi:hypothetical protein
MSQLKAVRQLILVLTAPSETRNKRHLTSETQFLLFRNFVLHKILETLQNISSVKSPCLIQKKKKNLASLNRLSSPVKLETVKGKAIPVQAWRGPEGSRMLRLPDYITVGT